MSTPISPDLESIQEMDRRQREEFRKEVRDALASQDAKLCRILEETEPEPEPAPSPEPQPSNPSDPPSDPAQPEPLSPPPTPTPSQEEEQERQRLQEEEEVRQLAQQRLAEESARKKSNAGRWI
jgi:hypothetical protein